MPKQATSRKRTSDTHTHTVHVQHILMLDHKTHTECVLVLAVNQSTKVLMPRWWWKSLLLTDTLKQTIHKTTFVAGDRATWLSAHKKMSISFYKLLENTPPVYLKATCRMYHAIFHTLHTQTMMLPSWQQQILQAGKAVYVLNKLHWLIQIPQSKQYYHMGLSMSKFGYFTIIACSYTCKQCAGQMAASNHWSSLFHSVSPVLLARPVAQTHLSSWRAVRSGQFSLHLTLEHS